MSEATWQPDRTHHVFDVMCEVSAVTECGAPAAGLDAVWQRRQSGSSACGKKYAVPWHHTRLEHASVCADSSPGTRMFIGAPLARGGESAL